MSTNELEKFKKQAQERINLLIDRHCNGSQQLFADMTGIGKASVSQFVHGRNAPSNKTAAKIGTAFGYNPAWIQGFDVPEKVIAKNLAEPNAHAIPILGRIACGNGAFTEDSYSGQFVLDASVRADFCLIASGDSMVDAGIEDGDRVFIRKALEFREGDIYAVVIKGEDVATLKRVYKKDGRLLLTPCNPAYTPVCLPEEEVFIVGSCIGIYKALN